jgi:hypothetical protein
LAKSSFKDDRHFGYITKLTKKDIALLPLTDIPISKSQIQVPKETNKQREKKKGDLNNVPNHRSPQVIDTRSPNRQPPCWNSTWNRGQTHLFNQLTIAILKRDLESRGYTLVQPIVNRHVGTASGIEGPTADLFFFFQGAVLTFAVSIKERYPTGR